MFNLKNIHKEFECLEEPLTNKIKRDLFSIIIKIRYSLLPFSYEEKIKYLRDWDLYGPIMISVSYLFLMMTKTNNLVDFFSSFFIVLIFGTLLVTFNIRLMGGQGSVFLFLSILGYCLSPFLISAIVKITLGNINGIFVN